MARHTPHIARRGRGRAVVGALVLAACGSTASSDDAPAPREPVVAATGNIEPSARDDVPSGLRTFREPLADLPAPTIDLSRLRSGGPPPDGIPSIDDPVFHTAASVDYMEPQSPVLALEIDGDARAYPLDVLVWHEIVNDTVGGVPVAVEYCPLCNSATVFDRRIAGRVLEFGVSGLLYNSSLVMYDRQTETLWSHFAGTPLYGFLGTEELVAYPTSVVGFGEWRAAHPEGLVLSRETGHDRNYGVNPYPGYDDVDSDPFLFDGDVDGRYTAMTRVVGVAQDAPSSAIAIPLLELREAGVVAGTLGDTPIVALWAPGSASALDRASVSAGVDVGSTGVFVPEVDGMALTFSAADGVFSDAETGSTWNVFGTAIAGELAGSRLEQAVHIDTFWFAWSAFHPDTTVVTPG